MNNLSVGDVVISVAGRDKGKYLLIAAEENGRFSVINGKERRVDSPKRKNGKHLKKVSSVDESLAEKLRRSEAVGNDEIKKALKSVIENKEEKK